MGETSRGRIRASECRCQKLNAQEDLDDRKTAYKACGLWTERRSKTAVLSAPAWLKLPQPPVID